MTVLQRWEGVVMFLVMAVVAGMIARGRWVSGRIGFRAGPEFRREDNPQQFFLAWLPLPAVALLLAWVALGLALGWIRH